MPIRQEFTVAGLAPPISHYCDAVRFGDLLFISGLVGVDAQGNVVGEGDAARQTRQIFENMRGVLDAAGAGFGDVLKVTVFLKNIEDRAHINPVRQEFFGSARPASTLHRGQPSGPPRPAGRDRGGGRVAPQRSGDPQVVALTRDLLH